MLGRMRIETEKVYDNCSMILKEFDRDNCQFSKDVEILLNVYANASKNVTISNSEWTMCHMYLSIYLFYSFSPARQCSNFVVTNVHRFVCQASGAL